MFKFGASILVCALLSAGTASALPFNDDMVGDQPITGSMMRPEPAGSVSVGALARTFTAEEAEAAVNPMRGDADSAARGKRLFAVNCSPCHGHYDETGYTRGRSGEVIDAVFQGARNIPIFSPEEKIFAEQESGFKAKGVPLESAPTLRKTYQTLVNAQDGHFFRVMHFGWGLMPAYGWKLSIEEHWDIVNYIRKIQRGE